MRPVVKAIVERCAKSFSWNVMVLYRSQQSFTQSPDVDSIYGWLQQSVSDIKQFIMIFKHALVEQKRAADVDDIEMCNIELYLMTAVQL